MTYLLDTNVLSALRRPARHPALADWAQALDPERVYVSVLTLGEIEAGIERARRKDIAFSQALEAWLDTTRAQFGGRIMPFELEAALIWGRLSADLGNSGVDLMIAATALEHDLTLVTRNARHFAGAGVRIFNPFEAV